LKDEDDLEQIQSIETDAVYGEDFYDFYDFFVIFRPRTYDVCEHWSSTSTLVLIARRAVMVALESPQ
jgi:hypothetical protein